MDREVVSSLAVLAAVYDACCAAMKLLLMLQGFLVRPCKGVVLDDKILQVILTNRIRCLDNDYFMANVFISQAGSLLSFCCITWITTLLHY